MPAKFLFERIFQLLVSLLIKSFQLELLSIQKNSSPSPLFLPILDDGFFHQVAYFRFAAMHILPTEVPRKWKSPLRETRGQGGGGGERRWPLIALRRERGEEEGEEEEGVGGGESRQLLRQRCCGIGGGLPGSAGGSPGGNTRTILWDPLARYRPLTHASTDGPRPES